MKTISSPYNFVPLNRYVYIPEWWNQVYNDVPFTDGEEGTIEFTIKNLSPLFTRNGSKSKKEKYSAHVLIDGQKYYFIPGSSIKGMLRSTLEILSFGKMEQYNDRSFGYRTFNEKENDYETYHSIIKNQKCGWIEKKNGSYRLIPCDGDFVLIDIREVERKYPNLSKKKGIRDRNEAIMKNKVLYPIYDKNGQNYYLVCTGKMFSKKHEYLFPTKQKEPISLMESDGGKKKVLKQFLSVYAQNKDATGFIDNYLEKGKRIHVFYVTDEYDDNTIIAMGLSKMMKLPYSNSIKDLVDNRQEQPQERDLCETIFGYITDNDNDSSLKGRVQVCNAFCVDKEGKKYAIEDERLINVSGVLGEPKPSFYPFYLEQNERNGKHLNYEEAESIAGRKLYRTHQSNNGKALPKGNDNENTKTSLSVLPSGLSFVCRINLHNMKPIEIGALLKAIKLEEGAYHNMGMAKGFGYGKIVCSNIKLNLKHSIEEYIQAFNNEMNTWGSLSYKNAEWNLAKRVETAMFFAIRKEHADQDVRMIEMRKATGKTRPDGKPETKNEFLEVKKNFQLIKEVGVNLSSLQKKSDSESRSQKEALKLAKNNAKNEWKRMQKQENADKSSTEAQEITANQPLSFSQQLEQAPSVGQLTKMIENQFKKESRKALLEEELNALTKGIINVIHSLEVKMNKSELKQKGAWQPDGSIWKKVSDLVGKEVFIKAFPRFDSV